MNFSIISDFGRVICIVLKTFLFLAAAFLTADVRDLSRKRDNTNYFFQSLVSEEVMRTEKVEFVHVSKIVRVYSRGCCLELEKVDHRGSPKAPKRG